MNSNLLMLCGVIDPAVMTESGTVHTWVDHWHS